jgi:hypothetical protein
MRRRGAVSAPSISRSAISRRYFNGASQLAISRPAVDDPNSAPYGSVDGHVAVTELLTKIRVPASRSSTARRGANARSKPVRRSARRKGAASL